MKTKKISWQAIAIVFLALVLIASIALGVSGAWFQDSDKVESTATMGNPVTVRLAAMDSENHPSTWSDVYKAGRAFPGDKILGETRILLGYDTMSVVRVSISAKIYDTDGTTEITAENVEARAALAAASVPNLYDKTTEEYKAEYTESFNALKAIMDSATVNTSVWSTKSAGGYFYFNTLANNATKTQKNSTNVDGLYLFDELNIPLTVKNAANNWNIEVKLNVEAIQAANLKDGQLPDGWTWGDIPSTLQSAISTYNSNGADGRLK